MGKKSKEPEKPSTAWLGTYGDMITLMLCFFVMLYNPSEVDVVEAQAIMMSIQMNATDTPVGGLSLSSGKLSDLGNTINALPSIEKGNQLGSVRRRAISLFAPDINSNRITISADERGLVVTLASDGFFDEGSAELNIDQTRDTLLRLADFFKSSDMVGRKFRIEGHTDNTPVAADSIFPSNWELSAARSINVLHYLSDFGVNENQFSVAGYADTRPKYSNDTPESRAYNRRIDIIIIDDGHF